MLTFEKRTWANIDLDAFRYNISKIKSLTQAKLLIPIKADAYGHGSCEIARISEELDIDCLGVAGIEEAIELREYGISLPIVILSPVFDFDIEDIIRYDIIPTLTDRKFTDVFNNYAKERKHVRDVFIEIDTGMGRTGLEYKKAFDEILYIKKKYKNISIKGIFSHFSTAEDEISQFAYNQIELFAKIKKKLKNAGLDDVMYNFVNSAALLRFPDMHLNMVRPGLLAYGLYTDISLKKYIDVKPIMSLYTRISRIVDMKKGDTVSYGMKILDRNLKVATINIGYADGFPRCLSDKGYVLVHGKLCRVLGNVCMDLTMVDVSGIDDIKIGDTVVVIGSSGNNIVSADAIAKVCKTINYEVITRIGERVTRIYYDNNKPISIRSIANRIIHTKL